jgi:hypothetical protein
MTAAALLRRRQRGRQPPGQPQPIGQLTQQPCASVRHDTASTSSYNQARTTSATLHLGSALLLLELLRLATTVSLATEGLSVI